MHSFRLTKSLQELFPMNVQVLMEMVTALALIIFNIFSISITPKDSSSHKQWALVSIVKNPMMEVVLVFHAKLVSLLMVIKLVPLIKMFH